MSWRVAVYCLLIAALLFFLPAWLQGRVYMPSDFLKASYPTRVSSDYDLANPNVENYGDLQDVLLQLYPGERFAELELRRGRLPLWDPHIGAGIPVHAMNPSVVSFPLHWPFALIGGLFGRSLEQLCALLCLGAGMLYFLRSLGRSPEAALLGALVWMFGAWTIGWLQFLAFTWASAFLPVALACLEDLRQGQRRSVWPLALALGLLFSSGALLVSLFCVPMVVGYTLYRLRPADWWRPGLSLLLGLGLAAPVWMAQLEATLASGRGSLDAVSTVSSGLAPRELLNWLWPFWLGSPGEGFYLGGQANSGVVNGREHSLYLGILPFLLALGGAGRRESRPWLGLALLTLAYALDTPFTTLVQSLCPPARGIPVTRVLLLTQLAMVVLLSRGWDAGLTRRLTGASCAVVGLSTLLVGWLCGRAQSDPALLAGWLHLGQGAVFKPPYYEGPVPYGQFLGQHLLEHFSWFHWHIWLPVVLALTILAVAWAGWRRALLLLTLADLLGYAGQMNVAQPVRHFFPAFQAQSELPQALRQPLPCAQPPLRMAGYRHFSQPNALACYGYFDVALAQSLMLKNYRSLFRAICPQENFLLEAGLFQPDRYSSGLADLLGVGLHYCDPFTELPVPFGPGLLRKDLRYQTWPTGQRGFLVGAARVLSQKQLVEQLLAADFDPRRCVLLSGETSGATEGEPGPVGEVRWESYDSNELSVEVSTPVVAWFLLNDTMSPGWQATLDGRNTPILTADLAFRAVRVEPGRHRLCMRYRPRSFVIGLPIQVVCLVLLGLGWFLGRRPGKLAADSNPPG